MRTQFIVDRLCAQIRGGWMLGNPLSKATNKINLYYKLSNLKNYT